MSNNGIPTTPAPAPAASAAAPAKTPQASLAELKSAIDNFRFYTNPENIPGPIGGFIKSIGEAKNPIK